MEQQREKGRNQSIVEEEKHMSEVSTKIKQSLKEKRKKQMEEHSELLKKVEAAQ